MKNESVPSIVRSTIKMLKVLQVLDSSCEDHENDCEFSYRSKAGVVPVKCRGIELESSFASSLEQPGDEYFSYHCGALRPPAERMFKVVIVGDPAVGKTSFTQRYTNNTFHQNYKGTIGVDFALKVLKLSKRETVKIQLWDIAGQERLTWMTRVYYRGSFGCIIIFDLGNKKTFRNAARWKRDVDLKCAFPDGSPLPTLLIGNKCDLREREVIQEDIDDAVSKGNYIGYVEVSVKENIMVEQSMKLLLDDMIIKDRCTWSAIQSSGEDSISLHEKNKRKIKCC